LYVRVVLELILSVTLRQRNILQETIF